MKWIRTSFVLALAAMPAVAFATEQAPPPAAQGEKHIDPKADQMLRQMTDYLAHLQNFQAMSSTLDEVVTQDGRKIQLSTDHTVKVSRPNRLASEELGAANRMGFWDDGKNMTLFCNADNTYATVPSPATIDQTIDTVRKDYKIDAPGADLLYSHPYDILTEQVTGGQFIGKETVDGTPANHLAFQGDDVDWQIWIQDGAQPLPLRYIITSKKVKGEPEFSVRLSHWEPQASFADNTFQFQPPAGAKRVATFPASCGTAHPHK